MRDTPSSRYSAATTTSGAVGDNSGSTPGQRASLDITSSVFGRKKAAAGVSGTGSSATATVRTNSNIVGEFRQPRTSTRGGLVLGVLGLRIPFRRQVESIQNRNLVV